MLTPSQSRRITKECYRSRHSGKGNSFLLELLTWLHSSNNTAALALIDAFLQGSKSAIATGSRRDKDWQGQALVLTCCVLLHFPIDLANVFSKQLKQARMEARGAVSPGRVREIAEMLAVSVKDVEEALTLNLENEELAIDYLLNNPPGALIWTYSHV